MNQAFLWIEFQIDSEDNALHDDGYKRPEGQSASIDTSDESVPSYKLLHEEISSLSLHRISQLLHRIVQP